jgi:SAM-dependent methyltransferase/ribosomal protein S18 acetylase RimI-like enzyme
VNSAALPPNFQPPAAVFLRDARPDDLDAIVQVHLAAFHPGFTLSALGPGFLRKYYDLVLRFDQGILLAAEKEGKLAGFAAGFLNPKRFYDTMNANKWRFALPIVRALIHRPRLVWRVLPLLRRVLHPTQRSLPSESVACELASIAVRPDVSGPGGGKALVCAFLRASRESKAAELYLTTDALDNARTNMFYRRLGFRFARCYSAPGHRLMNEYVLALGEGLPPAAAAADEGFRAAAEAIPAAQAPAREHLLPSTPAPSLFELEEARIKAAYGKRPVADQRYSWFNPGHVFMEHDFEKRCLQLLEKMAVAQVLGTKTVLEVGCGIGIRLRQLIKWGAQPENLVGIDLLSEAIAEAKRLCPATVRLLCGDAVTLDFPDAAFDLVLQSTVFTSILDAEMKRHLACEMLRLLKPDGFILWYDFFVDNPQNPNVRAVSKEEIRELFPGCRIELQRITLAPPISRKLAPYSWGLSYLLERIPWLRTHYLGVIQKG